MIAANTNQSAKKIPFLGISYRAMCAGALMVWAQLSIGAAAWGQIPAPPENQATHQSPSGVSYADVEDQVWRIGVRLKGGAKSSKNVRITIPVPTDWPEQTVQVLQKNVPGEFQQFQIRETGPLLTQIVAGTSTLRAGQEMELTMDLKVTLRRVIAPEDTTKYVIPKSVAKDLREYLDVSPGISYRDSKLRGTVKEVMQSEQVAWEQVRAISRWIQENIKQTEDEPVDSLECFRKKAGHGEDVVGLFVAMCRAAKIPARMVWVEGSQYAEFYLVDESDTGHWFPCTIAGLPEFGSVSHPRLIDQKGDNFRVPEKKNPQKYVVEFMACDGPGEPAVQFIRQRVVEAEGKANK